MSRLYNILNKLSGHAVIESGEKNGWIYRRFSDGRVEAYAYLNLGSKTGAVWASPIRYVDFSATIPSGIFSVAPRLVATSYTSQWWVNSINATSATAFGGRLCTLGTAASNANITVYATSYA